MSSDLNLSPFGSFHFMNRRFSTGFMFSFQFRWVHWRTWPGPACVLRVVSTLHVENIMTRRGHVSMASSVLFETSKEFHSRRTSCIRSRYKTRSLTYTIASWRRDRRNRTNDATTIATRRFYARLNHNSSGIHTSCELLLWSEATRNKRHKDSSRLLASTRTILVWFTWLNDVIYAQYMLGTTNCDNEPACIAMTST